MEFFIFLGLLFFILFMIRCFSQTKLNGFNNFTAFVFTITFLTLIICIIFNFNFDKELNWKEGSQVYRIYFIFRLVSISLNFLYFFVCIGITFFIIDFESMKVDEDVKISIINSFSTIPVGWIAIFVLSIISSLFGFLALTHQFYWTQKLDQCWCTNNLIFKEKRAQDILNRAEAEDQSSNK